MKRFASKLLPLALALLFAPTLASAEDLMQIYEKARQSDPLLAKTEAQALSIGERVDQATAQLLPQISASLNFSDSHGTSTSVQPVQDDAGNFVLVPYSRNSDGRSRALNGTLSQSIFDFGRWTARKSAQETAKSADATYEAAQQDLLMRTATAYFAVLTAADLLTFAEAEEKALARQLDQAQQRYEVGLSAITDVNEAKAQHDSSTARVINAQNALNDTREALREITGAEVGDLKPLRQELPLQEPMPNDINAWVDQAVAQNPTLQAQSLAVEAAKADINTARSGHLPTLSGSINYQKTPSWGESSSAGNVFHTNNDGSDTTIGLVLNVPIFTGGYTQSRVRQSIHDRDAAVDTYEQQKRAIERATRSNFRAVNAGISEVEARKQAVVSARSALEATQAGFEVGTRTIVDVLISQQQLFQAQSDHTLARHNFILNGLRLRQSAGSIAASDLEGVNALLE